MAFAARGHQHAADAAELEAFHDDSSLEDENESTWAELKGRKAVRGADSEMSGLSASLRRYPTAVYFMLGNEFCERFSFYGMRAVLTLYLISEHGLSGAHASLIFHAFVSLAYLSPLFGSIAADNYFGRFRVILWVSLVYVGGHVLLSIGALPGLATPLRTTLDFGGLLVIALATGGIKPCVSAFAADQFGAGQTRQREQFFSFFYFAINAGSLLAILTTPALRGRVKCFGSEYCFPLAFGVPGVLMAVALLFFVAGWRFYKRTAPAGENVVWDVCRCVCDALRRRASGRLTNKQHWLDYADERFDRALVDDVKRLASIFVLFFPVVFFWALFDQQGSTWILQARRMNGRVGRLTILPDQMNIFNPIFILALVPIFETAIYPGLRKLGIRVSALRKMALGGLLAAAAFVIAGIVQLEVNKTLVSQPAQGNTLLVAINLSPCTLNVSKNGSSFLIRSDTKETTQLEDIEVGVWHVSGEGACGHDGHIEATSTSHGHVLAIFQSAVKLQRFDLEKTEHGKTRIYTLAEEAIEQSAYLIAQEKGEGKEEDRARLADDYLDIEPGFLSSETYSLRVESNCSGQGACADGGWTAADDFKARMGAAHALAAAADGRSALVQLVQPNTVNLLWQLPQFFVMTLGEVLFSITGLEFSYSQAAPRLKSVLQAVWLLTVFAGNLIAMVISGSRVVAEPAAEFFFYAALMAAVMLVFIALASRYVYADPDRRASTDNVIEMKSAD